MPGYKEQVRVVPLTVHFGDREYIDGVTIDHKTFYEKLVEEDTLPTTSQATPDAFAKEFEAAKQAGESCVVITLSGKLSGTCQSASIAAADYENVYVVDSGTASVGGGVLTERVLQLRDEGLSAQEIAARLNEEKQLIVTVALVDTLEYLKRGGRISKSLAFAGTMLQIKPVLAVTDGEIQLLGKARGSKMGNNLLAQEQSHQVFRPIMVGNAQCFGHVQCDSIIMGQAKIESVPAITANCPDAQLIHEAAIGKIAGDQLLKLETLGLTEEEAEDTILKGFLA